MHKYIIEDAATRYTRVTKAEARRLYESGQTIHLCAHRLQPTEGGIDMSNADGGEFNAMVRAFQYYNCNLLETGFYAAFYTTEPRRRTLL